MEKNNFSKFLLAFQICLFIFFSPLTHSESNIRIGEDYYGNDLDAAVSEAKINERKVNYNNKYWYNRTTSKSFSLPKLDSEELEKAQLEGALLPSASGGANTSKNENERFLLNPKELETTDNEFQSINITVEDQAITTKAPISIPNISHEFTRGDKVTTQSIISSGTVTSSPRP